MSGSATASVEVLTAEVRVLMVGSRQVTLSVYRQLDSVEPWEIEAFGRVHAGGKFQPPPLWGVKEEALNLLEVVGRSNSGALVRAGLVHDHYRDGREPYPRWSRLPLIVLAGLR